MILDTFKHNVKDLTDEELISKYFRTNHTSIGYLTIMNQELTKRGYTPEKLRELYPEEYI